MSETKYIAVEAGRVEPVDFERVAPKEGELAGRTVATLVSPGTELAMAYAEEPRYPFPVKLGYSAVLEVEATGEGVDDVAIGDLVFTMGPHASYQVAAADRCICVPNGLDPGTATFARILNIAMAVQSTSPVAPGADVAIIGLGLVGQITARAFVASGLSVLAVDSSAERRAAAEPGVSTAIMLPARSFNLVIDCSGNEESVLAGAEALRDGGELVLIGVPWRPRSDIRLYPLLDQIFHRYLRVRSGWEWQLPFHPDPRTGGANMVSNLKRALMWLQSGAVPVDGLATTIRPSELVDAYAQLRMRVAPTLTFQVDWL